MAADYTDPHNTAIKPSLDSLEGKIMALMASLAGLGAALGVVIAFYPGNENLKMAGMVLAAVMAALGTFVAKLHGDDRSEQKQTANIVAGALAMADKAVAISKDNPDLARDILKSAGISVPTPPASS